MTTVRGGGDVIGGVPRLSVFMTEEILDDILDDLCRDAKVEVKSRDAAAGGVLIGPETERVDVEAIEARLEARDGA